MNEEQARFIGNAIETLQHELRAVEARAISMEFLVQALLLTAPNRPAVLRQAEELIGRYAVAPTDSVVIPDAIARLRQLLHAHQLPAE